MEQEGRVMEETIHIEINSLHEIPMAYQMAIERFKNVLRENEADDDIWDGQIELLRVDFQDNFRRVKFNCVFKIRLL